MSGWPPVQPGLPVRNSVRPRRRGRLPSFARGRRACGLDPNIRARKHEGLVTVVVTDEVRRCTVGASNLEDDRSVVMLSDKPCPEMETITRGGVHGYSQLTILAPVCTSRCAPEAEIWSLICST
jgi:hypothetical protein